METTGNASVSMVTQQSLQNTVISFFSSMLLLGICSEVENLYNLSKKPFDEQPEMESKGYAGKKGSLKILF